VHFEGLVMSSSDATVAPVPSRGLVSWICTSNPFYVLSAGLFLIGLRLSFGGAAREVDTWALMGGLAGYTLLLAAAALVLVRFAGVWDDVRTVLLLVVLMFLATSVTFDELLVLDPGRGTLVNVAGLLFAALVTEGLLRGARLRLPAWFRLPYHLVLALFFLYPLALVPLLKQPQSEELAWALFGFSTVAGLTFLTLLPAARRGPGYVRDTGSPWPWPYYPWSVFVFLGAAVVGRAFLICWSLHPLAGSNMDHLIFGPYFLVPFGLAVAAVLLELGLTADRRDVQAVALAVPAGLVALAAVGHRDDPVYAEFLQVFALRLGGTPLFLAVLAAAGFYLYAWARRVPFAVDGLTAAVAALAIVGPDALTVRDLGGPLPFPVYAAGVLQLAVGMRRWDALRCLGGGLAVAASVAVAVPNEWAVRAAVGFHLGLAVVLGVGAAFNGIVGRVCRTLGAVLIVAACLGAVISPPVALPQSAALYPLVMVAVLVGYGRLLGHQASVALAVVALAGYLAVTSVKGYRTLREEVAGLDYLVLGLALLPVAVLVSLYRSGTLTRWLARGRPPAASA
jgi:hypothetical protein